MRIATIQEVAARQLCTGCGACASLAPDRYRMDDVVDHGRRPIALSLPIADQKERGLLDVCPGINLSHDRGTWDEGYDPSLADTWGPVLETWKGYASDERARYEGSSGGVATAIGLHAARSPELGGVLQIRSRRSQPWLNETVLSTTEDEVREACGSRYAPASPLDSLGLIRASERPCVFVGKPCDVAAMHAIMRQDPEMRAKVALTVAIFCAGTPTWRGTIEMLKAMGFDDPTKVEYLRYRGHGWPGHAAARGEIDGKRTEVKFSYDQSWNAILHKYRQWRCYICPDHTGEFADVSVGDPWYEPPKEGAKGESLVIARTSRGREFIRRMMASGELALTSVPGTVIEASQPNLVLARGAVWGRVASLRLAGAPAPRFHGLPMFRLWLTKLSIKEKLRSTIGTLRRMGKKRLKQLLEMTPMPQGR